MKVLYIVLSITALGGILFLLVAYYPHEEIADALPIDLIEENNYIAYFPPTEDAIKHLIIIAPPGGGKEHAITYITYWRHQADTHSFALLAFPNLETSDEVGTAIRNLPEIFSNMKVILTGLSAGGYFSCYLGLANVDIVDAIVPMASFCDGYAVQDYPNLQVPILVVIGSKDVWALGDDGQLPYSRQGDLREEFMIVDGLGHAFPHQAMDEIGDWVTRI